MPGGIEDLVILREAEAIGDGTWETVVHWDGFAQDVVGKQFARAADSIGANIAEMYGRYHLGEKVQFLYYARGSLFETKYWLSRARTRHLLPEGEFEARSQALQTLARMLNNFVAGLKKSRQPVGSQLKEDSAPYGPSLLHTLPSVLFTDEDLAWLAD